MTFFFILAKVGWLVAQPIGLLTLALLAIVVALFLKAYRLARWIALIGLLVLVAATHTNLGRLIIQPLENRFARPTDLPDGDTVAGIIVLGGGFNGFVTRARGGFELNDAGDRFVEALRLARALPDKPLVISGGPASLIGVAEGDAPVATRFYTEFGLDPERLVLEQRSRNTFENGLYTKEAISGFPAGRWLLVTSAFHMPRSAGVFRKQGIDVLPWPVDYRTAGDERFSFGRNDPAEAFLELSLALRERVGIAVYAVTGRSEPTRER